MIFLASTSEELGFKIPQAGLWTLMVKYLGIEKYNIDMDESFFCGNDAGRQTLLDFSSDDILFAYNIGLKFYTP